MGFIRPATPGFIVTCIATILLAIVSFCVPFFKSVYFLKASISVAGKNGTITFGTLGYCLELPHNSTCSKPTVGYELDINGLVGNKLPVQIPQVVVKWLTYCLVLHIIALGLSAGSAVFGLLAHVREMSMACCSTCVSGFAAAVALLAFIFDIAIFFAAKARINAVGTAVIGNATWLTLAAWVLLFFSGCFFTLGRCCISKRGPRSNKWDKVQSPVAGHTASDQLRLDAVKAEADRKARQKDVEVGLPAFHEVQPLTGHVDGDKVYLDEPHQQNALAYGGHPAQSAPYTSGGYVKAPAGSRAVDEYYSPTPIDHAASTYPPAPQPTHSYGPSGYSQHTPPAPQRQPSGYAQSQYSKSNYAPSTYNYNAPQTSSPPPAQQYFPNTASQQYPDPYNASGREYGHVAGGSSYHTAVSHDRQGTNYSNYDAYDPQQQHPAYNNYGASPATAPSASYVPSPSNYYQSQPPQESPHQNERSYSLGGGSYAANNGYGANSLPPLPEHSTSYFPPASSTSPPLPVPINTNTGYISPTQTSPVKGPRALNQLMVRNEDESPPVYDAGSSNIQGAWGKAL